jgi:hypothetical protein
MNGKGISSLLGNLSIVLVVVLSGPVIASGKVIYVDTDATGANDGSSWTDAYNFLQDALADANSAVKPIELLVAQGIYKPDANSADPNGSGDRAATFRLINGLSLRGGYAGFGELDPNARDTKLYEAILSGDLAGNDVFVSDVSLVYTDPCRAENSFHVVTGSETDKTAFLDGFTISAGNSKYSAKIHGGGIYNYEGEPTITNCTFSANSYAAMFNYRSIPILMGCRFIRNAGGGIRNDESDSTIENCVFKANQDNGICNENSNSTVNNCIFSGNRGVYGGGMWNNGGNSIVNGCLFTGNRVSRYGGAIVNEGWLRISNCEFFGNSAALGGGIENRDYLRISNCTFVGNRGGGIFNEGFTQTSNCIFWGNTPCQLFPNNSELLIATYSNVQDGWPGEGNMDIDPCFVELGYWDDPCNTPDQDWDDIWINGDYHLKSQAGRWDANEGRWTKDEVTSPCIDAGNPGCPLGDEPAPNGNRINMGAFGGTAEASKSPEGWSLLADLNNDGICNFDDFAYQAKDWQETASRQPGDLNRDGTVNRADLALVVYDWLEYCRLLTACNPSPAHCALDVPVDANLGWSRIEYCLQDEVYLGTDPCALALVATIPAVLPPLYNPPADLIASTTYYWRVDETDANMLTHTGPVWSFSTISGKAQCDYPADGAVIEGEDYPFTGEPTHIWTTLDFLPGPTAVKHTAYFSDKWEDVLLRVQDANLGSPPNPTIAPYRYYVGLPVVEPYIESLVRGTVYYWTVDETDALGNTFPGDIWEFAIYGFYAFAPDPPNEAVYVDPNVLLSWLPGLYVCCHDFYIGTSWEEVDNADRSDTTGIYRGYTLEPFYQCSNLVFNTKYYWRVDEVSPRSCIPSLCAGPCYKGDVWCFTTRPEGVDTIREDLRFGIAGRVAGDLYSAPPLPTTHTVVNNGQELKTNDGRINMGAYGGTAQAGRTYLGEPVWEIIDSEDINDDCVVNFKNFAIMALHWLQDENQ